jgi:hypothetical protein
VVQRENTIPHASMILLIFMVAPQTERIDAVGSGTRRFDTVTSRVTLRPWEKMLQRWRLTFTSCRQTAETVSGL